MEVFSTVSGAISIAALAVKVVKHLHELRSRKRASRTDPIVVQIREELNNIADHSDAVEKNLTECKKQSYPPPEVCVIESSVRQILIDCSLLLSQGQGLLENTTEDSTKCKAARDEFLKQQSARTYEQVTNIEKQLSESMRVLNFHTSVPSVCIISNNGHILNEKLENLHNIIMAPLDNPSQIPSKPNSTPPSPSRSVRDIQGSANIVNGDRAIDPLHDDRQGTGTRHECVRWLEEAAAALRNGGLAVHHTENSDKNTAFATEASPQSNDESVVIIEDPAPGFKPVTLRPVIDKLRPSLLSEVDKNIDACEYKQAEEAQLDAIALHEELEHHYAVPFKERVSMQCKLGEIYRRQKKFEEAGRILKSACAADISATTQVPAPLEVDRYREHASTYLEYANVHRGWYLETKKRGYLMAAERDVKRVLLCRASESLEVPDPVFRKAVELLVQIYRQDMMKHLHAETYRTLYQRARDHATEQQPENEISDVRICHNPTVNRVPTARGSAYKFYLREILTFALKSQENPDRRLYEGKTALEHAIDGEEKDSLCGLVQKGANKNNGLLYAVKQGMSEMVEFLLDLNGDIEVRDADGLTPLLLAAQRKKVSVMKVLVRRGANQRARGLSGERWTALHYIAKAGHFTVLRAFVETDSPAGCDKLHIDETCDFGRTALHIAARRGDWRIIQKLLDYGADYSLADRGGQTCMSFAIQEEYPEVVQGLHERYEVPLKFDVPTRNQTIRYYLGRFQREHDLAERSREPGFRTGFRISRWSSSRL